MQENHSKYQFGWGINKKRNISDRTKHDNRDTAHFGKLSPHQLSGLKMLLLMRIKNTQGFTLIELIVVMAITSIIIALASQSLLQVQNSFEKDQKKVITYQKTSSILEIIGREVRQAGELITDQGFPVLQVKPLTNTPSGPVSLIIYRAISDPLPICQAYPAATAINALLFAIDTPTAGGCRVLAADTAATSNSLRLQAEWNDRRTVGGTVTSGKVLGMVGNNRIFQPFVYSSDPAPVAGANSVNLRVGTNLFTPATPINSNSNAYLVVKKEYLICSNNLMVRINSTVESTLGSPACGAIDSSTDPTGVLDVVATNITEINVNMITRQRPTPDSPNPPQDHCNSSVDDAGNGNNIAFPTTFSSACAAAPSATRDWQNIQGVIVNIVATNPLVGGTPASYSSQGTFYPRNVLSTK